MKVNLKILMAAAMLAFGLTVVSCGDDEPAEPEQKENDNTLPEAQEIVGKWVDESNDKHTLEFDRSGYVSINSNGHITVQKWNYNVGEYCWKTEWYTYTIINGRLYEDNGSRIYSRASENNEPETPETPDEPVSVSDDSRIFGKWVCPNYYGDRYELEFTQDGHLRETVEGELSVTLFTLENGILSLDEDLGIAISNVFGDQMNCKFLSSNKMTLSNKYDSMTFTKM